MAGAPTLIAETLTLPMKLKIERWQDIGNQKLIFYIKSFTLVAVLCFGNLAV
ncbi:hypothetical protein [Pedobacter punctiformis]|uniref:hypothetical protein n=1 Tax=Pedobacter punctiformis TaxID=3004097 RepID=UPI0022B204F2|nr:hypothetical protein [Pedobacter sp. HCMS5-2]